MGGCPLVPPHRARLVGCPIVGRVSHCRSHCRSLSVPKAWQNALKRAGITDFRWHDLRHTWASGHVQSGTSLQELQEFGGWSSFEMVLRYAHLAADHLRSAACRIEGTTLAQKEEAKGLRLVVSR